MASCGPSKIMELRNENLYLSRHRPCIDHREAVAVCRNSHHGCIAAIAPTMRATRAATIVFIGRAYGGFNSEALDELVTVHLSDGDQDIAGELTVSPADQALVDRI